MPSILVLILATLALLCIRTSASIKYKSIPIVTIADENVYGMYQLVESRLISTFLGIPYAQPPLGSLRFQRPVPKEKPSEPKYFLWHAPACQQLSVQHYPWTDNESGKSEDCLYLNIWVPQLKADTGLKAVMFYIHGGYFRVGSNRMEIYDGRVLAGIGDVIVVSTNYRLGPFGFLYSASDDAPGNAGLFDIIEALKWVNENIHNFGGDSKQITIFGQSAGSLTVGLLALSNLTRPLFNRMIMQSGSPCYLQLAKPQVNNFKLSLALAKSLGCESMDVDSFTNPKVAVDCLRRVNGDLLAITDQSIDQSDVKYLPQSGDIFLETSPEDLIRAGNIKKCELLIGNTEDEGAGFLTMGYSEHFGFFGEKNSSLSKSRGRELINGIFSDLNSEAIVNHYYGNVKDNNQNEIAKQTYKILGDTLLKCMSVYFAEKVAEKSNIYYYHFTHRPKTTPWRKWMGVPHFEEVQFVFGQPVLQPPKYSAKELLLSKELIKIWTSFAKTGKPESSFGNWPPYSRGFPKYMILNDVIKNQIGNIMGEGNCDFLRHIFGFV